SPESFAHAFDGFPGRAHIAVAQAPLPHGSGWQWFDWPPGTSQAELAAAMGAAEERVWPAIVSLAHGRKVILVGFSQGAMMSFLMAARHPDAVSLAIPIAGTLPKELWPTAPAKTAPIFALHGSDDDVIPLRWG